MRWFLLTSAFALAVTGCQDDTQSRVLRVGMPLADADKMLQDYGATPTNFQIVHPTHDLRWYNLPSGKVIAIASETEAGVPKLASLSVSTYTPKSWASKQDPERDRFFNSFNNVDTYELK